MRLLLTLFAVVIFLAALAFASVTGLYAYYARDLPDPGALSHRQLFQTARILDRNGRLLQELNDPQGGRRTLVHLSEIPMVARDATIAAEDASFYDNPGFDIRAVMRAAYQWVRTGAPQSGASTITQQLVKNTLLGPEQTAERKVKEAFLAMELTRRYSKDQILEMYMNEISYGNRAYGIEAAAETYFGKQARDLSLAEASLLAGLPQAPSYYDPLHNPSAALARRDEVLHALRRSRDITATQYALAVRDRSLHLRPSPAYAIHPYSAIIAGGDLRTPPMLPVEELLTHLEETVRQCWPKPKPTGRGSETVVFNGVSSGNGHLTGKSAQENGATAHAS